ncbi:MAG TPA: chromate resistance protein ChrB domain-containing protein [Candidatus Limnocylindria bacterium]|nr:chromate resistance protein ChrB domain-containing protein [Candidatus Limnocylindria bacterium]
MRWVTQEHVQVGRMCAAWLIERFVDPDAQIVFGPKVPAAEVTDGTPFHLEGGEFSNRDGRSTFEWIADAYGLSEKDPVLAALGPIVRAADEMHGPIRRGLSAREAMPPHAPLEAAGLHAALHGAGHLAADDADAVARSSAILDATYAGLGLRGKVTSLHEHPAGKPQ